MLTFRCLIVLFVFCLGAAPLHGQTAFERHGPFVGADIHPDWDDARNDLTRVPGVSWGSGIAFGLDAGTSGVEFNVAVPQWHVKSTQDRYQFGGPASGSLQQFHSYQSTTTVRRRSIDVMILRRANIPLNRHATLTWLVGGGYVYRPEQSTSVTQEVVPGAPLTVVDTHSRTFSRDYLAAAGGIDLEFSVVRHVSLVPRLRVFAFPSLVDDSGLAPKMFTARPELGVRWRF